MTSQQRLAKRMEHELARLTWRYRDGEFQAKSTHRIEGLRIECNFIGNTDCIRLAVTIEGDPLEEREFIGEQRMSDAIAWASETVTQFTDRFAKDIVATVQANMLYQLRRARCEYAGAPKEVQPLKE